MDILPYLLSYGLLGGMHTLGHVQTAQQLGVPINVDIGRLQEHWMTPDKEKNLKIQGGGFLMQDNLIPYFDDTSFKKQARIANAVYKLLYASGITPKMAQIEGDIKAMERLSGSPVTGLITTTSLFDILKAVDQKNRFKNINLGFWQSRTGAPGLLFTYRF